MTAWPVPPIRSLLISRYCSPNADFSAEIDIIKNQKDALRQLLALGPYATVPDEEFKLLASLLRIQSGSNSWFVISWLQVISPENSRRYELGFLSQCQVFQYLLVQLAASSIIIPNPKTCVAYVMCQCLLAIPGSPSALNVVLI